MATDVADGPIPLPSFPPAHLAWLPVPHRGDTSELSVAEVLEEWGEVFLNISSRVPFILESVLDVAPEVEVVPPSELIVRYADGNQGGPSLLPRCARGAEDEE